MLLTPTCFLLLGFALWETNAAPVKKCKSRRFSYSIADSEQCDKYYQCDAGVMEEQLCPDGLALEMDSMSCHFIPKVDCTSRPGLQPARSNKNCARLNGRYAVKDNCGAYYECNNGHSTLIPCPPGLVFDTKNVVCDFPDMVNRTDCTAESLIGFTCPHIFREDASLPFGDHERFPSEKDCRFYIMCLRNGKPRHGGCTFGKVFNPKTVACDSPQNVVGCEHYYEKKRVRNPDLVNSSEEKP